MKLAILFDLEMVRLTKRQRAELEVGELKDFEVLFGSHLDGQDWDQAHQPDNGYIGGSMKYQHGTTRQGQRGRQK